jgi:predicted transcriptional regulator
MSKYRVEYPRVNVGLSEYLPLLSTGLNLLSASWEFPAEPHTTRVRVRVRIDDAMAAQLDYIAEHSRKSKAAVITAALIHAQNSNRRPPTRASKKKGREPASSNEAD